MSKKWREYERLLAYLTLDEFDDQHTVIPNARINGFISQRKRQIDILVDYRFDTKLKRRVIFDAKLRNKPIDIKQVEAFEGLMKDVNAHRGFLICSNGYSKSALKRAQSHIGIKLVQASEIEKLDLNSWESCKSLKCENGLVLWDITPGIIIEGIVSVQATGKCDECGKFHIWCWACGNRHCIAFEDEWQCACHGPWFWLTSIEDEEDENGETYKCHYLLLIMANGSIEVVDRRPI